VSQSLVGLGVNRMIGGVISCVVNFSLNLDLSLRDLSKICGPGVVNLGLDCKICSLDLGYIS